MAETGVTYVRFLVPASHPAPVIVPPPVNERDHVGARGELIFSMLVTRRRPSRGVLFGIPRHLGEKHPTIDYYVELSGESPGRTYFLAQVRSTRRGYTAGGRLKVAVGGGHLRALAAYPAPTYLIGVDEAAERAYLLSASGPPGSGWSSMCTDHELTPVVLARLWDEVNDFWTSADRMAFASEFVDSRWRRQ